MRALITGINGFAGGHLAELLLSEGMEVYGTVLHPDNIESIAHLASHLTLLKCDVRRPEEMAGAIREATPHQIYHLAAISYVPDSWADPELALETNVMGGINLLNSLMEMEGEVTAVLITSADIYGKVAPEECPVTEDHPLRPLSPYGVSKAAFDLLASQYASMKGKRIIRVRPFNHIGPGQSPKFVASGFARQLAEIEAGKRESVIRVGTLTNRRDFTDVRDMVRGYRLAAQHCRSGQAYNICSGIPHSISDLLETLISISDADPEVREEPSRVRPSDNPLIIGSCEKFHRATGWKPNIPFEDSLRDILNYWREMV